MASGIFCCFKNAQSRVGPDESKRTETSKRTKKLLKNIQQQVIGNNVIFQSPFGKRHVIYCDFTAAGRSLAAIEDYINDFVRPMYGNTHTTTSLVSQQTSHFRAEARQIIKNAVNCSADDVLIFTGNGCTSAVHKVIGVMGLKSESKVTSQNKTVVLIGPFEHHSNTLPWRETVDEVVPIRITDKGVADLIHLETELKVGKEIYMAVDMVRFNQISMIMPFQRFRSKCSTLIVTFSAASNVTGIFTDVDAVATLAHAYGAYAFFDYASGAPYLDINMNPSKKAYKDAIFFSPHKFIGGPGTPGVLIAKKHLFKNDVPDKCGGGTVLYVTRENHVYLKDIEEREEGGTPGIVESIRTGLIFRLKQAIGTHAIEELEHRLSRKAISSLKNAPGLVLLGSLEAERLPIFSFLVQHECGLFLHHNFVSLILNDLFGIQARGGCACAGPYAESLLGISDAAAKDITWFLETRQLKNGGVQQSLGAMKPGFTRLNFPFFYDDDVINFIIEALRIVGESGWKLLPYYRFDFRTGDWHHRSPGSGEAAYSLYDLSFEPGAAFGSRKNRPPKTVDKVNLKSVLNTAKKIIKNADQQMDSRAILLDPNIDIEIPVIKRQLRWFMTPKEAFFLMQQRPDKTTAAISTLSIKSIYSDLVKPNYVLFSR